MAPELLEEEEEIDCKVDIWSLGIIIHQMFARGVHPFGPKERIKVNMKKGKYILDNGIKDEKVIKVLKGCFEVDPDQRISVGEILQTLDFVDIIKNPEKNEDKQEKK